MTRALLVVDIQQALIDLEPTNKDTYLAKVDKAIAHFRERGEEVIFVQHTEDDGELLTLNSKGWQLYAGLDVRKDDKIIRKYFNSTFRRTELESYLKEKAIDQLVVCGMQVEYCINATLTVGFEKEINLTVLSDAVTTYDRDNMTGQAIMDFYNQTIWSNFAKVIPTDRLN